MAILAHENQMANAAFSKDHAKNDIRQKLGAEEFDKIYLYLKAERSKAKFNESVMYANIEQIVGKDKAKMLLIFKLDGIVFNELMQNATALNK
jgi:hypothetical protein